MNVCGDWNNFIQYHKQVVKRLNLWTVLLAKKYPEFYSFLCNNRKAYIQYASARIFNYSIFRPALFENFEIEKAVALLMKSLIIF